MNITFLWCPRYYDNSVLLSTRAVKKGKNYIAFSADPKLNHLYSVTDEVIKKYPTQKNGKGSVYIIPFTELEDEGNLPSEYMEKKNQSRLEYIAWKNNLKN